LGDWQILQVSGKTALAEIIGCDGADILISNQSDDRGRPCKVIDIEKLRVSGSLAISTTLTGDLEVITAQSIAGNRPWSAQSDGDPAALSFVLRAGPPQFAEN
jgi:competence protein ComEC